MEEVMAALDTDYASEPYTCGPGNNDLEEVGDMPGDRHIISMAERREKACLGEAAKMVIGPAWRSPDASTSQEASMFDDAYLIVPVHRFHLIAYLQASQRKALG